VFNFGDVDVESVPCFRRVIATLRITAVQKGLCIVPLTIAVIVFALFLADLVLGFAGMKELAPFKFSNMIIDIVFVVCSLVLAVMSWFTLREQV
jgi:hypothetical protein